MLIILYDITRAERVKYFHISHSLDVIRVATVICCMVTHHKMQTMFLQYGK